MALDRNDQVDPQQPATFRPQVTYDTPNIVDVTVVETVPEQPANYTPLPYGTPHPDNAVTGLPLKLVWQGPVKSANNQVVVKRVYSTKDTNQDWFNFAIKYSGEDASSPIFVRSYRTLREAYVSATRGQPLDTIIGLHLTAGGSGYTSDPAVSFSGGGGSGAAARVIRDLKSQAIVGLELTDEGSGYTSAPTVTITGGGGTGATATAAIQPQNALLVKEETQKLDQESPQEHSLFVKVVRVYETLPGPWISSTRLDDDGAVVSIAKRRNLVGDIASSETLNLNTWTKATKGEGDAIVAEEVVETRAIPGFPVPSTIVDPDGVTVFITETLKAATAISASEQVTSGIWTETHAEKLGDLVSREVTMARAVPGNPIVSAKLAEDGEVRLTAKTLKESASISPREYVSGGVYHRVTKDDVPYVRGFAIRAGDKVAWEVDESRPVPGETWNERRLTSEFGGGIIRIDRTIDEPGQTPDSGFLIVESSVKKLEGILLEIKETAVLSPESAEPTLELVLAGSAYTTPPAVGFTGGTGTPAVADAVLGFAVETIDIDAAGSGYTDPPAVGFDGGEGGGALASAQLGFGVEEIIPSANGDAYTSAPTVGITGDGTGAAATAVLGKGVASVAVTAVGSGFTEAPAVEFDGDGAGAAGNAIMGHPVKEVILDTAGSGYTTAPTIGFSGGSGTGAAATAVLGKAVASATVTAAGSGYTQPPELSITGDGTGADIVGRLGVVGTPVVVNGGTGYTVGDVLTVLDGAGTSITAAQLLVTAVSGGVITAVSIQTVGVYPDLPANPVSVSGGTGTGATFTLTWGLSRLDVLAGGSGYTTPPTIGFINAHGGTGSTMTTTLAAAGVIKTVTLTNGGSGYLTVPTVSLSGGGGSGGAIHATIDETLLSISSVQIISAGSGYTTAPTVSFVGGGGTGATATATLASAGIVKSVTMTSAGTGYTSPPAISFSGGGGSGAAAFSHLAIAGSVKSVSILTGGLFETTPTLSFVGGGGSGAAGTAHLATSGPVKRLELTTPGLYTVAPTVTFSGGGGSGATAIYHIGDALWPTLIGHHTDPREGIVIDLFKTVIPHGTPHPGRGNYVDDQHYDRWKTIRIVSSVDLSTLPLPETYPILHAFHLPPTLLAIRAIWSDAGSKLAKSLATNASAKVSSGASGGIIVKRSGGFHGYASAMVTRIWSFGPPPPTAIPQPFNPITASGSVVLRQYDSKTEIARGLDGGTIVGDDNSTRVHAIDIENHIVGAFDILDDSHQSPPRTAIAESGPDTSTDPAGPPVIVGVSAYGQICTMTVDIPRSNPSRLIPGQVVLAAVNVEKWRFGVWVLELIQVTIPDTTLA